MNNNLSSLSHPTDQMLQELKEAAIPSQQKQPQKSSNQRKKQMLQIGSQNQKIQESLSCRKKPKRNLTAYNFFFREERQKIIELGLEEYNSKSFKKTKRDDNENVLSELNISPKDSDTYQVCSKICSDQKLRAAIRNQGSCQIGSVSRRAILGSILREEENSLAPSSSISDQRLSATKSQETSRRESASSNDFDSIDSTIRDEDKPLKSTSSIQRKRKKSPHYKVSFGDLGKVIAKRWKEISTEDLDRYKNLAETDLKRYNREKEVFHKAEESELFLHDLQYAPCSQTAHIEAACITDEATLLQQQQESTQRSLDIIAPTSFSPVNHSLNNEMQRALSLIATINSSLHDEMIHQGMGDLNSLESLNSVLPPSSSALLNQICRSSTIPLEVFRSSISPNLHRLSLQTPLFSSPSRSDPLILSLLYGNIEAKRARRQEMHSSDALNISSIRSQFLASPVITGGVNLPFRGHVATSGFPFITGEGLFHGTQLNRSYVLPVPLLNTCQSVAVPASQEMAEHVSTESVNQAFTTTFTIDRTNHSLSAENTMNPPDFH